MIFNLVSLNKEAGVEEKTKEFLRKVKFNTYIYTFTFMAVSIGYSVKHSLGVEPFMLLMASFAFYTIGRQITTLSEIESGSKADNQPKVQPWIRGVVYLIVILMVLSVMFS